jgi:hypothetical protein
VGIEELDLEPSIANRRLLSDQLIQALFDDRAVAISVYVVTASSTRRLIVDRNPKTDLAVP